MADIRRNAVVGLFDLPLYLDPFVYLAGFAVTASLVNTFTDYSGSVLDSFTLTAIAIDLAFGVTFQIALFGVLPAAIRSALRRRSGTSSTYSGSCGACGAALLGGAAFCPACGAQVPRPIAPQPNFCPTCGAERVSPAATGWSAPPPPSPGPAWAAPPPPPAPAPAAHRSAFSRAFVDGATPPNAP